MTTEPSRDVPPEEVVNGKYRLLRLIGRGGMGSVWEGQHVSLDTRVAVKFIEAEYVNSQDARSRFTREARAAATIESKHAIQIYDHGVTEQGRPYIVMELLTGEALDARLKALVRLPMADTARIIQQVCRALHRAHERGIIHRDLKPENIFLVRHPDDDDEIAKVLDFGIAKIKETPGALSLSSSTKTGTLLGTPYFMSPEQARGLREVDHRSDLWALGVIVFKCLTGVLPFDGESLGDLLVKICAMPIPVPSSVLPGLPPAIDAWMARALDREPQTRFQSAQELADSLAVACGISVRRPPASVTPSNAAYAPVASRATVPMTRGSATPGASPAQGQAVQPQAVLVGTSAPFTASAPPQGSSKPYRSAIVAGGALAIATVSFLVVYALFGGAGRHPAETASGATPSSLASSGPTLAASGPAVPTAVLATSPASPLAIDPAGAPPPTSSSARSKPVPNSAPPSLSSPSSPLGSPIKSAKAKPTASALPPLPALPAGAKPSPKPTAATPPTNSPSMNNAAGY